MSFFKKLFGTNKGANSFEDRVPENQSSKPEGLESNSSGNAPSANRPSPTSSSGNKPPEQKPGATVPGAQEPVESAEKDQQTWIEPADSPWGVRVLDIRPVTQTMVSTSSNPQMATNAMSYSGEDGRAFWHHPPLTEKQVTAELSFPIDKTLEPGPLFIPRKMEHKWAIYFDGENLLFVRSWRREVIVSAKTSQENHRLTVRSISGAFSPNDGFDFDIAMLRFLVISHCVGEIVPAPLPKALEHNPKDSGLWAFSVYGNMAHFAIFNLDYVPDAQRPLRSLSLLHIAVAKGQIEEIEADFKNGARLDYLASDGLAPLHWAIVPDGTSSLVKLLELGADPDVRSAEGATPIMNAAQRGDRLNHLVLLLQAGASVNAMDNNGLTALHRAAEGGFDEIVAALLNNGADRSLSAHGHTALSLAKAEGREKVVEMLK